MTVEEINPELFLWELYNANGVQELDVALHIAVKFGYPAVRREARRRANAIHSCV